MTVRGAVLGPFIQPLPYYYVLLSFLFFHLTNFHPLLHCPVLLTVVGLSRVLDGIAMIGMMRMSTGVAHAPDWSGEERWSRYIITRGVE